MAAELATRLAVDPGDTGNISLNAEEDIFVERFSIVNQDLNLAFQIACGPSSVRPGSTFWISARLGNDGPFPIASSPNAPVNLSYHWLEQDGAVHLFEGFRTGLPAPIPSGGAMTIPMQVEAPSKPGRYRLQLIPVHESIRWVDECTHELPIDVTADSPTQATPIRMEAELGLFDGVRDTELATAFMNEALQRRPSAIARQVCEIGGGIWPSFLNTTQTPDTVALFLNLDISIRLLQVGEFMLRRNRHPLEAHIIGARADANHLPVKPASLDIVVFSRALHHFPRPDLALKECARVLRTGGLLFLLCEPVNAAYDDHTLDLIRKGVNEQIFADGLYASMAEAAGLTPSEQILDWGFSYKGCFVRQGLDLPTPSDRHQERGTSFQVQQPETVPL